MFELNQHENLDFIPFSIGHSEISICNATAFKTAFKMSQERSKVLKSISEVKWSWNSLEFFLVLC